MNPQHPWSHYEYGRLDHEIFQNMGFSGMVINFELDMGPFLEFCKTRPLPTHATLMKISHYLSKKYLPQRTLGLNHRDYPAGAAAGYVRIKDKGRDPLESITLEEVDGELREVSLRTDSPGWQRWIMRNAPGLAILLAKRILPGTSVARYPALQISRNYLPGLKARIVSTTFTTPRSHFLAIPYGKKVVASFHAPHCFANIQFYEEFLESFRAFIETPEVIPAEALELRYIAL